VKILQTNQTRQEYFDTQIGRSDRKFSFCKVAIDDVVAYHAVIAAGPGRRAPSRPLGPVLCLGTRNGREIDLFRVGFFGGRARRALIRACERRHDPFGSYLPLVEGGLRSRVEALGPHSAIGVEINPRARRSDVWVGSFDEMPAAWGGTFGVVFSNAFDQSQDPARTAREWSRVLRPGGYLVFCYAEGTAPTTTDPVADLRLSDVLGMFKGEMLFYRQRGSRSGYTEVIVRTPEGGAAS